MTAQPVSAAYLVSASGTNGAWRIKDSSTAPSGRCINDNQFGGDPTQYLTKIRVWPPRVFGWEPGQYVGWRFLVLRRLHNEGQPWEVWWRSRIQKDTATGSTPANDFTPMEWWPEYAIYESGDYWDFTAQVEMFWYKPGTRKKVAGTARLQLEWARHMYPGHPEAGDIGVFECPLSRVRPRPPLGRCAAPRWSDAPRSRRNLDQAVRVGRT